MHNIRLLNVAYILVGTDSTESGAKQATRVVIHLNHFYTFTGYPDICSTSWKNISLGETFNITSPYYPLNYPNHQDCICIVHSSDHALGTIDFVVTILHFILEASYDFLILGTGQVAATDDNTDSEVITLTYGDYPTDGINIVGPTMWMRFTSDFSSNRQGFFLSVVTSLRNLTGKIDLQCFHYLNLWNQFLTSLRFCSLGGFTHNHFTIIWDSEILVDIGRGSQKKNPVTIVHILKCVFWTLEL